MKFPDSIVIFGITLYCNYQSSSDKYCYYNSDLFDIEIGLDFNEIHWTSSRMGMGFSIYDHSLCENNIEEIIENNFISEMNMPVIFFENIIKKMKVDILK